jgi:hypothetical protein
LTAAGSPSPVLGPLYQIRPQGVAFHVPQHQQQIGIILDREALEPPLVKVADCRSKASNS